MASEAPRRGRGPDRLLARFWPAEQTERRLDDIGELYGNWVLQELTDLRARGVLVVIVHHGDTVFELPFEVAAVFAKTCPRLNGCLALDRFLAGHPSDEVFLEDGHWAAGGHRIAAERIAAYLQRLPGFGAAGDGERPTEPPPPVLGRGEDASADPL